MAKRRTIAKAPTTKAVARKSARPSTARAKRPTKSAARPRPKHSFVLHRFSEEGFKIDGLRTYARYRDLGINAATRGQAIAHVIRFVPPCDPKVVSKNHFHDVDFQMIYVLKGWLTSSFEGQGTHTMKAGDAWLQPPRIKHKVLDYSDDCEVLEIVMPGEFKTVELDG